MGYAGGSQQGIQALGQVREEAVVELHDGPAGAVVSVQHLNLRLAEFLLQTGSQQVPVASSPTVDALFDVSHHQRIVAAVYAAVHQRPKVIPLDIRGILKLIQEEILVPHAHFFVNERRIGSVNNAVQDGIGIVQRQHVLLLLNLRKGIPQFPCHAQTVQLPFENERRHILLISRAEELQIRLQRPLQRRLDRREEVGFGLDEPLLGVLGLSDKGLRGFDGAVEVFGNGTQEAPIEVREIYTHALQGLLDGFHRRLELFGVGFDNGFAADAELVHCLFVVLDLPFRNLEEVLGYGLEAVFQTYSALFLEVLLHAAGEPVQKRGVLLRQAVQHAVHALGDEGLAVHLHLIRRKLPNLS